MKRRILAVLLAAALVFTMASCAGTPSQAPASGGDSSAAQGDAYQQKLNLEIANGDIPDFMVVTFQQYEALVKADLLADLTDYFDTILAPCTEKPTGLPTTST